MNREIKFRAWDKSKRIMYSSNCTNLLLHFNGQLQSYDEYGKLLGTFNTPEMKIMQYIGLKDKNGKEIYENDILKVLVRQKEKHAPVDGLETIVDDLFSDIGLKETYFWTVEYVNFNTYSGFRCYGTNRRFNIPLTYSTLINTEAEIIGNIYENPELLEAQQ